jgi:hypothetical protein
MFRHFTALAIAVAPAIPAYAQTPAAAPATAAGAALNSADTPIGDLLDDPRAKAILTKYLPEVVNSDQIEMARAMSLKAIQSYAPDQISDAKLAEIDAELARLSPGK